MTKTIESDFPHFSSLFWYIDDIKDAWKMPHLVTSPREFSHAETLFCHHCHSLRLHFFRVLYHHRDQIHTHHSFNLPTFIDIA